MVPRGFTLCLLAIFLAAGDVEAQTSAAFYSIRSTASPHQLIAPDGKPFFMTGVCAVSFQMDTIQGTDIAPYTLAVAKKYGSREGWADATRRNLAAWGFNTLGAWSDPDLARMGESPVHFAYTSVLDLGSGFSGRSAHGAAWAWLNGIFPDVFDPAFSDYCRDQAQEKCVPSKSDQDLVGRFTDNELRWSGTDRFPDELLITFLNLDKKAPGREAALAMLHSRYPQIDSFNRVWQTSFSSWGDADESPKFVTPPGFFRPPSYFQNPAVRDLIRNPEAAAFLSDCYAFAGRVARKYFQVTHDTIKSADPNHLLLGCRFSIMPPPEVLEAAAQYEDVISLNCYDPDPRPILSLYAETRKPLLITEFAFRARDSICPNTQGAGQLLPTQQDRAAAFERFASAAAECPYLAGYAWFKLVDEPKEGRFDGENSNYGLVDINDNPYGALVDKMSEVNRRLQQAYSQSR